MVILYSSYIRFDIELYIIFYIWITFVLCKILYQVMDPPSHTGSLPPLMHMGYAVSRSCELKTTTLFRGFVWGSESLGVIRI